MQLEFIIALAIAIPVILFPAAFIWYINIGGLLEAMKTRQAKAAREKATELAK